MVAGAGLMAMGVPSPLLAAGIVGGGSMLLNPRQSLGQGLMTGLSAYGGANLGQALAQQGMQAAAGVPEAAKQVGALTAESAPIQIAAAQQAAAEAAAKTSAAQTAYGSGNFMARAGTMGTGIASLGQEGAMTGLVNNLGGPVSAMRTGASLATPFLVESDNRTVPVPQVDRDPGQQYDYYPGTALPTPSADPYGREKTYYSGFFRPRTTTAANGGMMGWPAGESVIKMADGGVPRYFGGGAVIFDLLQTEPGFRKLFGLGPNPNDSVKKYTYDQQNQKYLENGMSTPSGAPQGYDYNAQNQQFTEQVPPTTPMASGGISDLRYNLGGYSDGGRLLRGPGDGVSDSIPATIANKQPARLADGEFVVPARIVSELGNGSTEAGARKLYAMMDRVQKARGNTVGKGKVAKNSRADKYLPA
jgi:hypothetical protein